MSATRSQAILAGSAGVRLGLALLVTVFVGRILDPEQFGFFALVGTLLSVAAVIVDLGSGAMAAREIAVHPERERALLEGLIAVRRIIAMVLSVIIVGFAFLEEHGARRTVLLGVAATVLLSYWNALYTVFLVRQTQGVPALVGTFSQLLVLVGAGLFWALRLAGEVFGWLLVVRDILIAIVIRRLASMGLGFRPVPGLRSRNLGRFYSALAVHSLAVLSHTLYFHADVFMVRLLRGSEELGAYASAFRLVNPLLVLAGVLMVPLLPVFSASAVADRNRFGFQVRGAAWVLLGFGSMVCIGGFGIASDLTALLYAGRYSSSALDASMALSWLSLALGSVVVSSTFITALQADRKEHLLLIIGAVGLLINVVGNWWLLPGHGFTAAAAMTFATELFVLGATAVVFLRGTPLSDAWRPDRLLVFVPGLVLFLSCRLVERPMSKLAAGGIVGICGSIALLRTPVGREYRASVSEA